MFKLVFTLTCKMFSLKIFIINHILLGSILDIVSRTDMPSQLLYMQLHQCSYIIVYDGPIGRSYCYIIQHFCPLNLPSFYQLLGPSCLTTDAALLHLLRGTPMWPRQISCEKADKRVVGVLQCQGNLTPTRYASLKGCHQYPRSQYKNPVNRASSA